MTYNEFAQFTPIQLNEQQRQAVEQTSGATLLLAVPGSGKTTTLVSRLGYLLYGCGVQPENILTMTYTVAASRDMRERFRALFGDRYAERLEFRTINGVCASILHRYFWESGAAPFALLEDNSRIIVEAARSAYREYPEDSEVKELQRELTYLKNMMLTPEEIEERTVCGKPSSALLACYETIKKRERLMDYDDQMIYARTILLKYPHILSQLHRRYPYLCVDEVQDSSRIQHVLIRMLAGERANLFMVGDEDQSIYGFRAAFPRALMHFEADYPGGQVLVLEENFRSTPEIVAAANRLIARNRDRHPKKMMTQNKSGEKLHILTLKDRSRQYAYIAAIAKRAPQQELAVLYRNNDSAVPLIDYLDREGLPYRCRQSESGFFSSRTVSGVRDILTLAKDMKNTELFLRVYYKLGLGIKRGMAEDAAAAVKEGRSGSCIRAMILLAGENPWLQGKLLALERDFEALPADHALQAVNRVRYQMGFGGYILQNGGDGERFFLLNTIAQREENAEALLTRLEHLRQLTEAGGDRKSNLILSTIHSSKGLEYDRVLLIDAVDGILPSVTASEDSKPEERELLEEERRIFYVGVTRAKQELMVLRYENQSEARFVEELAPPKSVPSEIGKGNPTGAKHVLHGLSSKSEKPSDEEYRPGTQICHRSFGSGVIRSVAGGMAEVEFAESGSKKISLAVCIEKKLIWRQEK